MKKAILTLSITLGVFFSGAVGAARGGVHMLPLNCAELLPDDTQFIQFFEAVASSRVDKDKALSKRLFRILAIRNKIRDQKDAIHEHNPIDVLIRKTLCFYREQKEPIQPVSFENPAFLEYLKTGLPELEAKVEDAIFMTEFEKEQRKLYERQIQKNRKLIQGVERQALREARDKYSRISKNARKKARAQ